MTEVERLMANPSSFWARFGRVFDRVRSSRPSQTLHQEWETYQIHKPGLLAYEGQYVLILGVEVVGVYPQRSDALRAGYLRAGFKTPFLVHEIRAVEPVSVVAHELP
jgi:hypothetical protein